MTRIANELGLPSNLDCNSLVEEAAHLAAKLGHGFVQTHQEKILQVEATVKEVQRKRKQEAHNSIQGFMNQNFNMWLPFKVWNQQNPNEKYKISFKSNVSPNLPMHCIAMGDIVGLARFHKNIQVGFQETGITNSSKQNPGGRTPIARPATKVELA